MLDYSFAEIFAETDDLPGLLQVTEQAIGCALVRGRGRVGPARVDVRPNGRRPEPGRAPRDFVEWPLLVELSLDDETDPEPAGQAPALVTLTAQLLVALWEGGIRAVVAADFEDELPWGGGLSRVEGPDSPTGD